MSVNYFTRVYFSRYFFSSYRSSLSKYTKFVPAATPAKDIYFFSDPYVFNRMRGKKVLNSTVGGMPFVGASQARSFFFRFNFFLNSNFYDYSWQIYKNDEEFFKKFFIIFIKSKLQLLFFHQYSLFVTKQIFKNYFNKK